MTVAVAASPGLTRPMQASILQGSGARLHRPRRGGPRNTESSEGGQGEREFGMRVRSHALCLPAHRKHTESALSGRWVHSKDGHLLVWGNALPLAGVVIAPRKAPAVGIVSGHRWVHLIVHLDGGIVERSRRTVCTAQSSNHTIWLVPCSHHHPSSASHLRGA